MNSDEIKAEVATYFRYSRQCPVIAFETPGECSWFGTELADVLIVDKRRFLYEIEIKVSMSDLRRDAQKQKHIYFRDNPKMRMAHYFYFAVPSDIGNVVDEECKHLYPYAGVIRVYSLSVSTTSLPSISISRNPKELNPARVSFKDIVWLVTAESGTICRLSRALIRAKEEEKRQREIATELHKELSLYRSK